MAYIDLDYYANEFGGTNLMDDDFSRLAAIASDTIDSIASVPFDINRLPQESASLVKKATAYQLETLFMQGGVDAIVGMAAQAADSESLADYRISKGATVAASASKVTLPTIGGIPVSQMAIMLMRKAGLMNRWAYHRQPLSCDSGNA